MECTISIIFSANFDNFGGDNRQFGAPYIPKRGGLLWIFWRWEAEGVCYARYERWSPSVAGVYLKTSLVLLRVKSFRSLIRITRFAV